METLDDLYRRKGEIQTHMEIMRTEYLKIQQQICGRVNDQRRAGSIIDKILNSKKGDGGK